MNNFTVSQIGDEILGTFDDGEHKLLVKQKATSDFLFDCACVIDSLGIKFHQLQKKIKRGKTNVSR